MVGMFEIILQTVISVWVQLPQVTMQKACSYKTLAVEWEVKTPYFNFALCKLPEQLNK